MGSLSVDSDLGPASTHHSHSWAQQSHSRAISRFHSLSRASTERLRQQSTLLLWGCSSCPGAGAPHLVFWVSSCHPGCWVCELASRLCVCMLPPQRVCRAWALGSQRCRQAGVPEAPPSTSDIPPASLLPCPAFFRAGRGVGFSPSHFAFPSVSQFATSFLM